MGGAPSASGQGFRAKPSEKTFQARCCSGYQAVPAQDLLPYHSVDDIKTCSAVLAKVDIRLEIRDKYCRDTVPISDGRRTARSIEEFASNLRDSRDESSDYGELPRATDLNRIE